MKTRLFILSLAVAAASPVFADALTGAGSTFGYPVMNLWTADYAKATGQNINYQPIGAREYIDFT